MPSISNVKFHILVESYHLQADLKNIIAVSWKLKKKPSSITELWSILGLVGYFRKSIPNFSQTASPLHQILNDNQNKQRHSKKPIAWNDNHQAALDKLLLHLVTPPILAYPEYDQSFILHTDASHLGLGCSWIQIQNGKLRVIDCVCESHIGSGQKKIPQLQVGIPSPDARSVWAFLRLFFLCTTLWCLHRL